MFFDGILTQYPHVIIQVAARTNVPLVDSSIILWVYQISVVSATVCIESSIMAMLVACVCVPPPRMFSMQALEYLHRKGMMHRDLKVCL